jgi:hypothetical protein
MSLDTKALEQLVRGSGLTYRENSVSWIFTCPRCSKKDKLYLRKRDGRFVCWRCASTQRFQGHPEYALRELLGMPLRDLQQKLYGDLTFSDTPFASLELRDFFGDEDEIPYDLPIPTTFFPEDFFPIDDSRARKGRRYLEEERGIGVELAQKFGLRYHPQSMRVIFPIVVRGNLVGWQGRHIRPKWTDENGRVWEVPKIETGPNTREYKFQDRDRCLMFQDTLDGADAAILLEGPIDGIKCHLGPAATVVSMGKSVSNGQLNILRNSGIKRLYLGIDPDAADEKTRLCRAFSDIEVYEMLPTLEDFGKMSPEEVVPVFLNARRITAGRIFMPPHVDFFTFTPTRERLQ